MMAENVISTTINYGTSGNFTFDNTKIDFPGSTAELKRNIPTNATLGMNYTTPTTGEATFAEIGNRNVTLSGASVINGFLDLEGNKFADYDGTNCVSSNTGSFKFIWKPSYNNKPNQDSYFWDLSNGVNNLDSITAFHDINGLIIFQMITSSATFVFNANLLAFVTEANREYEMLFTYDIITGKNQLRIDGVQQGLTNTGTGVRDGSGMTILRIGTNRGAIKANQCQITDFLYFTDVQETSNYTPGYTLDAPYATDDPTVLVNSGVGADSLKTFSAVINEDTDTAIRFHIQVNGQAKFYNGANFVNSDSSFAQSNTIAELNTNADSLLSSGVVLKIVAVLNSNGLRTPSVTSVTITYSFFEQEQNIALCTVFGYIKENNSIPIVGAEILFTTKDGGYNFEENFIFINAKTLTDSKGYFKQDLPRTALANNEEINVVISFTDTLTAQQRRELKIIVPNLSNSSLEDAISIS